ncbi:MAG: DegT/DnrJ/EryC1/StrS family aminotransferase [Gemmatimonadota bacterium]
MTRAATPPAPARLAVDGGPPAFAGRTGRAEPKIGVAEFLSIAERFGFKPDALARLRAAVTDADLEGEGPNLARFACPFPKATKTEQFEALARQVLGVPYARAVSSGTGALHAAFVAAGVGPGTEVIVPAMGFCATPMAAMLAGGVPVFCDVDESLQMDPRRVEPCITPRTVAVAPTHHWGGVCDMDPILEIARRRGLKVIEDCAQGPGGRYRGRPVGSLGDIGCFSISCYKIIGGGEGGLVVTGDARLFERLGQVMDGGGLCRPDRFGPEEYVGEVFPGTNYRMSELEAAVDLVQLGKLEQVVARIRQVSQRVRGRIGTYREVTPQKINDPEGWIGYRLGFFPATVDLGRRLAAALQKEGIGAHCRGTERHLDWHYYAEMLPVTLRHGHTPGGSVFDDPRYRPESGWPSYAPGTCPVADDLWARGVFVGLDQWWSPEDCDAVAAGIDKVLAAYCTPDPEAAPWT